MEIHRIRYPLQDRVNVAANGQVLAIGDFDGVHLGHREVIRRAVQHAKSLDVRSAVMTFDPHPREVLGKSQYSKYLTPRDEKMRQFSHLAVDDVYIVEFDHDLARVLPEQYFANMLVPLGLRAIVVGFDFTFGYKGQGTVETLVRLAKDQMDVEIVPPFHMDGEKVSSTLIREQLHLGQLSRVRQLLGRHYKIEGQVVRGEGRGRTIGFPTANLSLVEQYVIPRQGVYAVRVTAAGSLTWNGVMNIGVKPTFHDNEDQAPSLEVHLLDCSDDLYGEILQVELISFLRPEMKFASVDLLVQQIQKDVLRAREILA